MRVDEFEVIRWLQSAVKQRVVLDNTVIHVSEVTGCLRKAYYARTRAFKLTPGEAIILLGSQIHEAVQEVLAGMGFEPEFEVAVKRDGIKLVGHIDAYHPDENVVLELKTVRRVPKEPYRSHRFQAEIYGAIVEASEIYIIYISRNDGDVKVFKTSWSENTLDFAVKRAKLLSDCLDKREPPMREPSHLCDFCPFKLECKRISYNYNNRNKGSRERKGGGRDYGSRGKYKRYSRY